MGSRVGKGIGRRVGLREGVLDGRGVEGTGEGGDDGCGVGIAVGECEGAGVEGAGDGGAVGNGTGSCVGVDEGTVDGLDEDGAGDEGAAVGTGTGDEVGAGRQSLYTSAQQRTVAVREVLAHVVEPLLPHAPGAVMRPRTAPCPLLSASRRVQLVVVQVAADHPPNSEAQPVFQASLSINSSTEQRRAPTASQ